jgi:hypothetical protein
MLRNTLKAFGFLRIKYRGQNLNFVLYTLPVVFAIFICIFILIVDFNSSKAINIFTQNAFDSISTFVQVLPGFYIASLAAIASYNNPNVDNKMSGRPPYLEERVSGGKRPSDLSRRRFLTLMFGYLAAVSMILTIFLFFIRLSYDTAIFSVKPLVYSAVYYILCFVFFAIFLQMILITLHGIYYLADRMHRP